MKHTANSEREPRRTTKPIRRGRTNPSHPRLKPVADWEADVQAKSRGPNRADMQRKVQTRGIRRIDVLDLFEEANILLRQGYEVRLTSERDGDCIRLYPCLDANYTEMFVTAMSMGGFRTSIGDIPFRMQHRGEEVDPTDEWAAKQRKAETIRETRQHVTPDTLVTCPRCGNQFRVGKGAEVGGSWLVLPQAQAHGQARTARALTGRETRGWRSIAAPEEQGQYGDGEVLQEPSQYTRTATDSKMSPTAKQAEATTF